MSDQNGWFDRNSNPNPYQNPNNSYYPTPPQNPGQAFAAAAIVLAILGVVTFFMIIPPLFFGSLAIILALLSKGADSRTRRPASAAIPLGTLSIILGAAVFCFGIYSIIHQFGSFENYVNLIQQTVENYANGTTDSIDLSQLMEIMGAGQ